MDKYEATGSEKMMMAVVTTGNGGYERLECREVPISVPGIIPVRGLWEALNGH
jgi:hypothetical protein